MTPDLEDLIHQIDAVKVDGPLVCAGLTVSQFNWRPGPGRWSIAECLMHLNIGMNHVLPAFDRGIAEGHARGLMGTGPFRYGWFTRLVVRSMEPPLFRMKTVAPLAVPPSSHERDRVVADFLALRDQLADRVRQAAGLDLRRARVISPINRLIRLPLGGYFQFILAHDRRHLWQARQVRNALSASRQT